MIFLSGSAFICVSLSLHDLSDCYSVGKSLCTWLPYAIAGCSPQLYCWCKSAAESLWDSWKRWRVPFLFQPTPQHVFVPLCVHGKGNVDGHSLDFAVVTQFDMQRRQTSSATACLVSCLLTYFLRSTWWLFLTWTSDITLHYSPFVPFKRQQDLGERGAACRFISFHPNKQYQNSGVVRCEFGLRLSCSIRYFVLWLDRQVTNNGSLTYHSCSSSFSILTSSSEHGWTIAGVADFFCISSDTSCAASICTPTLFAIHSTCSSTLSNAINCLRTSV